MPWLNQTGETMIGGTCSGDSSSTHELEATPKPGARRAWVSRVTDFDLVCISHLRWDFVWQRPQQLLTRCARERRVFYVEEPVFGDASTPRLRTKRVSDCLVVAVPELPGGCSRAEAGEIQERLLRGLLLDFAVEEFVLWLYTPMAVAVYARARSTCPRLRLHGRAFRIRVRAARAAPSESTSSCSAPTSSSPAAAASTRRNSAAPARSPRSRAASTPPTSRSARLPGRRARRPGAMPDRPRLGYSGVIDERIDLELARRPGGRCDRTGSSCSLGRW